VNRLLLSGALAAALGLAACGGEDLVLPSEGEPADIANLAAFVLSAEGSLLHGAILDMDGGRIKTV